MPELVTDCPRCNVQHITFDVLSSNIFKVSYGWQNWYEAFCVCRKCLTSTIFVLVEKPDSHKFVQHRGLMQLAGVLNDLIAVDGYISQKDAAALPPPDFLPVGLSAAFNEGATCVAVGCFNAAATMFRLCVDIATKVILPKEERPGLNHRVRRDLGLRLSWLFDNGILPLALKELSSCIKEDGNDGAHVGNLTQADADDLYDFCFMLLERLYTEPQRLTQAKERREARRA